MVERAIQVIDGRASLIGSFGLDQANSIFLALSEGRPRTNEFCIDLSRATRVDKVALAALIAACRRHRGRGVTIRTEGPPVLAHTIERALASPSRSNGTARASFLELIGRGTVSQLARASSLVTMASATALAMARLAVRRTRLPRHALSDKIAAMGADAIGIIVMLSALLGMILAFEANRQLGPLGAKPLIPDVVGLSLVREFAPFLCAIVVIARNGAAITSELASMTTGQEVDALRTMGIDPIDYLVLPRTLGLLITSPILTLLAMFIGLFGATVITILFARLDVTLFYHRLVEAVSFSDVVFGIAKSLAFAVSTSLAAATIGLRVSASASDVGRATTRAVVLGIFLVVVSDAIFSFFSGVSYG